MIAAKPNLSTARLGALLLLLSAVTVGAAEAASAPQTVSFPGHGDSAPELVGYLFMPEGPGPHPAVVMLHGRGGPYSAKVNAGCTQVGAGQPASPCNATSLSPRHLDWGHHWAEQGYIALHVDSFGPRGRAHGYGRGTHGLPEREAVNERTVRPLDAEAALAYLLTRPDVQPGHVMLQGWSNGGSTVLNVMFRQARAPAGVPRFRAALAFYPGCGKQALLPPQAPDVPLQVFLAEDDEEVSPTTCRERLGRLAAPGLALQTYPGATHGFDSPGAHQEVPGNRLAREDALRRSTALFEAAARAP